VEESAPTLVRNAISTPGRQLDSAFRVSMEDHFGFDFSNVRVHTDEQAAESARAVNANAYTVGNHIAFAPDRYSTSTIGGRNLLAHELTHVVQQASGPVETTPMTDGLSVGNADGLHERRAVESADRIAHQAQTDKGLGLTTCPPRALGASVGSHLNVQRDTPPTPPDPTAARQADAADTANKISGASLAVAGAGLVTSIIGLVFAKQSLNAARRQADAAEDPPAPQPTDGGIKSTHDEVPPVEIKGSDSETTTVKDITAEEIKAGRAAKGDKVSVKIIDNDQQTITETTRKTKVGTVTVEKQTVPKPPKQEEQKTFDVLEIAEGKQNAATFKLNVRYGDGSIKGGNTEDGGIVGYSGGSVGSNASVTFKATAAAPVIPTTPKEAKNAPTPAPVAAFRLRFGGFNTPPRMTLGGENEKPEKRSNLQQRFAGSILFNATGAIQGTPSLAVNPLGSGTSPRGPFGDGQSKPIVSIQLNVDQSGPAKREEGEPTAPKKAGGAP